jgi:hypothetical protein
MEQLSTLPFEDLGFARIDHHRALRQGFPEVVFCAGKTVDQVVEIGERIVASGATLLATRADDEMRQALQARLDGIVCNILARTVARLYDVGVAGIHRLLASHEKIMSASVIVVVAGMEGALPSVVGGLVDVPVVAVPTSVGYGASFGGLAALLGMLNSCAAGVTVVNIDNGFGAGVAANKINRVGSRA